MRSGWWNWWTDRLTRVPDFEPRSFSSSFLGAAKCNGDGSSIVLELHHADYDYEDEEEDEKKNMSREDWIPRLYPNRTGRERMFWWRPRVQKSIEKQQFSD